MRYATRFIHCRARSGSQIKAKGGITIAMRRCDGNTFHYGIAVCWPTDPFDRRKGRQIAEGRMLKQRKGGHAVPLWGRIMKFDGASDLKKIPIDVWKVALAQAERVIEFADDPHSMKPIKLRPMATHERLYLASILEDGHRIIAHMKRGTEHVEVKA